MLTKADALEWQVHETLTDHGRPGLTLEMPWGEQVTMLAGGERTYMFPLTPREARAMRVLRVHGLLAALITYVRDR